jgi:hypothetical protein
MPTTIYDSSLITQRRRMKAESGSFINRIQNPQPNGSSGSNVTTGYAPLLGIYDQSIINTVKSGNMPFYQKNSSGYTSVDNGCPCNPVTGACDTN